jgi:hypothetical protein
MARNFGVFILVVPAIVQRQACPPIKWLFSTWHGHIEHNAAVAVRQACVHDVDIRQVGVLKVFRHSAIDLKCVDSMRQGCELQAVQS